MDVEQIWNKVRDKEAGDVEYALSSPDFRAKLGLAASEARAGRSTGIAGLEKFEEAVAKDADVTLNQSGVDAARTEGSNGPTVFGDAITPEDLGISNTTASGAEQSAKPTAKGSGAQKEEGKLSGKEKALHDAAGAGQKVESDEVNSPSYPSAARPLAAEAPGNAPGPGEKATKPKSSARKSSTTASKKK